MLKRMSSYALVCFVFLLMSGALHAMDKATVRTQGFDEGYRLGYHQALADRAAGQRADVAALPAYKRADVGYRGYMGHKGDYKKSFREGLAEGYSDAWSGQAGRLATIYAVPANPNLAYGNIYVYTVPRGLGSTDYAFNMGYRYGVNDGRKDLDDHKAFNPDRHDDYRDATVGYSSNLGDKNAYKSSFRQGYYQGYQDGFGVVAPAAPAAPVVPVEPVVPEAPAAPTPPQP